MFAWKYLTWFAVLFYVFVSDLELGLERMNLGQVILTIFSSALFGSSVLPVNTMAKWILLTEFSFGLWQRRIRIPNNMLFVLVGCKISSYTKSPREISSFLPVCLLFFL